jgi:hypothetical protein
MGMPRKIPSDLPARLHFKNGGYHYVHQNTWELLSRDKTEAVLLANALNSATAEQRKSSLAKMRDAAVAIRSYIMDRDNYSCAYCGSTHDLGIDHIIPWSKGGATLPFNLVVACLTCNTGKGDGDPREFIAAMKLRAQIIRHELVLLDRAEIVSDASA